MSALLFDGQSRNLVEWLLGKFESHYKHDWEEERFTVLPHPCQTKHGELDFDTIFFWKVYAQGYFAMQSRKISKLIPSSGHLRHIRSG